VILLHRSHTWLVASSQVSGPQAVRRSNLETMRVLSIALLLCACASAQDPTHFVYATGGRPTPAVTEMAVPVRGVQGVLAADGHYLGTVYTRAGGRVTAVRNAARAAAAAGGTHIVLRRADVTQVERSGVEFRRDAQVVKVDTNSPYTPPQRAELRQTSSVSDSDVSAVFDVFRVAPDRWGDLHEGIRPLPPAGGMHR
jgi:hypothetical protein